MGSQPLDPETERRVAIALFNDVWTLLETADRTPEQDDEMLHAAHASRFHWGRVGTPSNVTIGEWQLSRVYAVLGRPEPALHHGRRALEICERHGIGDFQLAFAHEALARASAVAGDAAARDRHLALAREAGAAIANPRDRGTLEQDLATIRAHPAAP